ncbi:MAG: transposase [Pyrinomonadaceae bacterium]|nr:transposase [Pyrinomonadaceae bacterium]
MNLKKRVFTKEFKLQVVNELDAGKPQADVAREHQLNANTISESDDMCLQPAVIER